MMMMGSLTSAVDRAVAATIVKRSLRAARLHDHDAEDLSVVATYEHPSPVFFDVPAAAKPKLTPVRNMLITKKGRVVDATWPSIAPFYENAAYLSHEANRTASARLFLQDDDRPARSAVLLVHGYLGGRYAFEERVWPIRKLFDRGFDVALFTLPFHGVRRARSTNTKVQLFPSTNPRFTNEGMRQAIGDLRALMRFFFARGTHHVGAMGMSLGGYTVALLATIEQALRFVVPVIPLADLASFTRGELAIDSIITPSHTTTLRTISPLARRPLVKGKDCIVIGADNDAIAPMVHARALAQHFNAPLETFSGGHILQFGRAEAFRKLLDERIAS
jgi:pimeloyl-ACP methyl ester carboxylesterase